MMPGLAQFMPTVAQQSIAPTPVDWGDIYEIGAGSTGPQIITGISEPILLRIQLSGVSVAGSCNIIESINGASLAVASGATMDVLVPPDTALEWTATAGRFAEGSGTAAVKYRSTEGGSFDQTLDTFTFSITGVGDGGGRDYR